MVERKERDWGGSHSKRPAYSGHRHGQHAKGSKLGDGLQRGVDKVTWVTTPTDRQSFGHEGDDDGISSCSA